MSTSTSAAARSSGSAPPVTPGPFERRAGKMLSQAAIYSLVEDMARAVDGMRTEMSMQTADVDWLCRAVRAISEKLGVDPDKREPGNPISRVLP